MRMECGLASEGGVCQKFVFPIICITGVRRASRASRRAGRPGAQKAPKRKKSPDIERQAQEKKFCPLNLSFSNWHKFPFFLVGSWGSDVISEFGRKFFRSTDPRENLEFRKIWPKIGFSSKISVFLKNDQKSEF